MTDLSYQIYVGVDWGTEEHRVVILDAERRVLHDRRVRQEAMALETFATWLSDLVGGRVDTVAVALETPRGALVETLLARGFHVFALNPKQLDRFRDRFTVAGAKDDSRDAHVLAARIFEGWLDAHVLKPAGISGGVRDSIRTGLDWYFALGPPQGLSDCRASRAIVARFREPFGRPAPFRKPPCFAAILIN